MSDLLVYRAARYCRRMAANGVRLWDSGFDRKLELAKWERSWKSELIERALKIRDGDFIDIGANIGQTLLDFRAIGNRSRYIGFEPNPISFSYLLKLVREHGFTQCVVLPIGLSNNTTVLNLYSLAREPTDVSASVVPDLRPGRKNTQTPIVCCRFDDLWDSLDVTSLGLIKIDVEGAELSVLRGMEKSLRKLRAPILCEILYADETADIEQYKKNVKSILNFLDQIQYAIYRVRIDKRGKDFFGLVRVTELPIRVWTPENAHECDYMLIPTEEVPNYAKLMG
jgi:FkbM family methyltransferase